MLDRISSTLDCQGGGGARTFCSPLHIQRHTLFELSLDTSLCLLARPRGFIAADIGNNPLGRQVVSQLVNITLRMIALVTWDILVHGVYPRSHLSIGTSSISYLVSSIPVCRFSSIGSIQSQASHHQDPAPSPER